MYNIYYNKPQRYSFFYMTHLFEKKILNLNRFS